MGVRVTGRTSDLQLDLFEPRFPTHEVLDAIRLPGREILAALPAEDGRGTGAERLPGTDVGGSGGTNGQLLTGMIKPMHFYYQEDFGRSTVLRVLGQSAGVTSCSTLDIGRFGSPLASLHYAEHLQLPYGCEVVGMTTGARLDRAHPMRRFAKQTDERLVSFNRHHPRIEVDIREGYLEQWLGPYLEDRYQDARGLYDAVSMAGFFEPTPYEVFLVAAPSSPESPVSSVFAWSALRPSDEMKINYRLFEAPGKVSGLNVLPEVFPQYTSPSFSSGSLAATLADVAGYGKDDVSIFQSIRDLELLPN